MTFTLNHKLLFLASLISVVYFGLLFSNLLQNINSVLIGAAIEYLTIPMIITQVGIFVYTLSLVVIDFIKKNKTPVEIIISLVISVTLVICMFLVK